MMRTKNTIHTFLLLMLCLLAAGCSTTSRVPDDDNLFVGLEKIKYLDYETTTWYRRKKRWRRH